MTGWFNSRKQRWRNKESLLSSSNKDIKIMWESIRSCMDYAERSPDSSRKKLLTHSLTSDNIMALQTLS